MGVEEWTIVVLVVGTRLLLPLLIPYYPLPGVISCLVLDAIDQSIFQQFPDIPLDGYQSYDKALDIYYLSITYVSTYRNWTNRTAFGMSRFLYFYRMVGVVAFELSQVRALLLIFPNTFEYFFIFCEGVRLRWNTARMGKWTVVVSTVLIWVFIKLPQEWWIHIAQLDMTDFIKEELFGVSTDATWAEAVSANPTVVVVAGLLLAALLALSWWIVVKKAPAGDHGPRLAADPLPPQAQAAELYRTVRVRERVFDYALLEKTVLTSLVCVIFASMLPGLEANPVYVAVSVAVFVVLNAMVSQVMARRGRSWQTVAWEMATMYAVNLVLAVILETGQRVLGLRDVNVPFLTLLFFTFLLTVIVVLFDRYRTVAVARGLEPASAEKAGEAATA